MSLAIPTKPVDQAATPSKGGFARTPHGLGAALALLEYKRWSRVPLQLVIERHFSPHAGKAVELSPTKLGKQLRGCRQSANRGIQILVRANLIVRDGLGRYRLNPDYHAWIDDQGEAKRFDEADLTWIEEAQRRVMDGCPASTPALADQLSPPESRQPLRLHTEAPALTDQDEPMEDGQRKRLQNEAPALTNAASPLEPPCIDTRTEEPLIPPTAPRSGESVGVGEDGGVPVFDFYGDRISLDCGIVNDPDEIRRVAALADDLFPMKEFGAKVYSFRKTYEAEWMKQLLMDAVCWTSPPRTFKPIHNTLKEWARMGGPPPSPGSGSAMSGSGRAPLSTGARREREWEAQALAAIAADEARARGKEDARA